MQEYTMQSRRIRISELTPHRLQKHTYGDLPPEEFLALKEDIQQRGMLDPIKITEARMIVDGHQRVRVCQQLGIDEIDAVVCDTMSPQEVDEAFVLANLMRRQLDVVAKANALQILVEIERQRRPADDEPLNGDWRDKIAKRLGGQLSGRTISRLLALAKLPASIRHAVSAGTLPMMRALKILSLPEDDQAQIETRIVAGEDARAVVDEFFPRNEPSGPETPADFYRTLIAFLQDNLPRLEAAGDMLTGATGDHEEAAYMLSRSSAFFNLMRDREQAASEAARSRQQQHLPDCVRTPCPDTVC
jgi:ParB/RepB/Spo0J family partition protein